MTSVHKLSTFDDAMDRVMMENNLKLEGDCSTSEDDEENEEIKEPEVVIKKKSTIKKQGSVKKKGKKKFEDVQQSTVKKSNKIIVDPKTALNEKS